MPVEDKLVNKWKRDEGSGLKGWLEENISKKGMKRSLDKAAAYQKKGMSKEVVPGITQGDLYSGLTAGTASAGIKTAKFGASKVLPYLLRVAEKGQPSRSVVAVETMGMGGKKFIQPFYKSSGTSRSAGGGYESARGGKYMPFLGRDTAGKLSGIKGWYIKGSRKLSGEASLHGDLPSFAKNLSKSEQDYWYRMRSKRLGKIGSEIESLEKTGKLKVTGTARTPEEVNKWLKGYGLDYKGVKWK